MSKYSIQQWNQTIDSSNSLRPIFTFQPDADFISYLKNNPGQPILMSIEGTDYYDGQQFGTCLSSADFPTFGPNYARVNNNYVMVLQTEFSLYPRTPGTMTILYDVRSPALTPCAYRTMTTESFEAPPSSEKTSMPHPLTTVADKDPPSSPHANLAWSVTIGLIALLVIILIFWWMYQCYVM